MILSRLLRDTVQYRLITDEKLLENTGSRQVGRNSRFVKPLAVGKLIKVFDGLYAAVLIGRIDAMMVLCKDNDRNSQRCNGERQP